MKQTSLALAITALLSTLSSASVQADPTCKLLTDTESDIDISRNNNTRDRCLPGNNPLQDQQWHLLNTGQNAFSASGGEAGNDLNLWWAHRMGILGQKIRVAVLDDGLAIRHPNLKENIRAGSYNFVNRSNDPTPPPPTEDTLEDGAHGTAVAGIIASADNDIGTLGVAPRVRLQGFNIIAKSPGLNVQTQQNFLYALGDNKDPHKQMKPNGKRGTIETGERDQDFIPENYNRIYNQSFGSSHLYPTTVNDNNLAQNQRDGLLEWTTKWDKAAYIKAAGNGFSNINSRGYNFWRRGHNPALPFENSNLDPSNTNFWNLVVSAVNANGKHASYSSVGSNVFISAPGGEYGTDSPAIVTTDLPGCDRGDNRAGDENRDRHVRNPNRLHTDKPLVDDNCEYVGTMNGTSAATPNTSGAMALLMSAYPDMSVRDLRDLLAHSATRIDADQQPAMVTYITESGRERTVTGLEGWERNAAKIETWFNPTYGFGLIDVNQALKDAKNHKPLPPLVKLPWQQTNVPEEEADIPDVGDAPTSSTTQINAPLIVEAVQVRVSLDHERLTDLLIELVSPSGTRSILLNPFTSLVGQAVDRHYSEDNTTDTDGLRDMRLLSNKFYGEAAQGAWRLEVTDVSSGDREFIQQNPQTGARTRLVEYNNIHSGKLTSWSLRILGHDINGN